jgi:replicative DNA helicase
MRWHSRPDDPAPSVSGQAELMLSKQRNGPTGKIQLVFLHNLTKFENRVSDLDDQNPPED